jgi:hypothetical protein
MRKTFLLLLFLGNTLTLFAQEKISFSYDSAGNQIIRRLCTDCLLRQSQSEFKNIAEIKPEDLQKFHPEDVISYYPNPVKELLYLQWQLIDENKVSSIEIYGMNGQLLKSYKNLESKNDFVISFTELPRNIYSINLVYTNGEHKPIKIIKN